MKKISLVALAVASLVGSSAALAENSGFYVDGSIGQMTANLPALAGVSVKNSDTTYSIGTGYNFNEYIGAEVGYQTLGTVGYSATVAGTTVINGNTIVGTGSLSANAKTDGFYFGPKVSYPINEQFSINARAGWYNWSATTTLAAAAAGTINGTAFAGNSSISAKTSGTDSYIGLGANYNVSKNVGVSLNYTQFKVSTITAKNLSLGAQYSF